MTQTDLSNRLVDLLADINPDAVLWDGLNDAVVGIALRGSKPVAVYDYDLMVGIFLARENGWSRADAVEWIEFNIVGAYVGTSTPFHIGLSDPWMDDDDGNDGGTFFDAGEA